MLNLIMLSFLILSSISCRTLIDKIKGKSEKEGDDCIASFTEEEQINHTLIPDLNIDIYVVNLESNTPNSKLNEVSQNRRDTISLRLQELGVPFEFFNATYGRAYSNSENNKDNGELILNSKPWKEQSFGKSNEYQYIYKRFRPSFSWGELGHRITFYELFKKIANNSRPALILEDDAFIDNYFKAKLHYTLKNAPENWRMLYPFCPNKNIKKSSERLYTPIKGRFLTNIAQIITPAAAKEISEKMLPFDDIPTDEWLARFPGLHDVYCSCPTYVHHTEEDSTINIEGRR
ncbi:MAG: glycosyltransferase family 25 protein [Oligoflexales bacterium]|nr:glycosyltransferase family 25 protein [Oligoflexales bacterium]